MTSPTDVLFNQTEVSDIQRAIIKGVQKHELEINIDVAGLRRKLNWTTMLILFSVSMIPLDFKT